MRCLSSNTLPSFFLAVTLPLVSAQLEQDLILPKFTFGYGNTWSNNVDKYSNWLTQGSADWDYEFLQIVKEYSSSTGVIWSQNQVYLDGVQFEFELSSRSREGAKNSLGTAFWLVEVDSLSNLIYTPGAGLHRFYGYRGDFRGIGVFLATRDPSGAPAQSISAVVADGSTMWDYKHLPTSTGIFTDFRDGYITMRITIENSIITGWFKGKQQENFIKAFQIVLPSTIFSTNNAYIGFGSVNTAPEPLSNATINHAMFGDQVTVKSLTTSVLNRQALVKQMNGSNDPAQLMKKVLENPNAATDTDSTRAMMELLIKHVIPRQELMQNSLSRLVNADHDLHNKIDVLRAVSSHEGNAKWTEAFSEVRKLLMNAQEEQAEKIGRVHGEMQAESVREMLKHSEGLKQSLATATTRNTYLSLGLGSVFVLMLIGIYIRMREMEKKHIL